MSLSMKQKQSHRHGKQVCACQGGQDTGERWTRSLELVYANDYI